MTYKEFQKMQFSIARHHLMVKLGENQYPLMLNDVYINLSTEMLDNVVIK